MVDKSDILLAVYDDERKNRSGTGYTVNYAQRLNKPTILIHPDTLKVKASQAVGLQNSDVPHVVGFTNTSTALI